MKKGWGWKLCLLNLDEAMCLAALTQSTLVRAFYIVQINSILNFERSKLTIQIKKFMITLGALQLLAQLLFFQKLFYNRTHSYFGISLKYLLVIYVIFFSKTAISGTY